MPTAKMRNSCYQGIEFNLAAFGQTEDVGCDEHTAGEEDISYMFQSPPPVTAMNFQSAGMVKPSTFTLVSGNSSRTHALPAGVAVSVPRGFLDLRLCCCGPLNPCSRGAAAMSYTSSITSFTLWAVARPKVREVCRVGVFPTALLRVPGV